MNTGARERGVGSPELELVICRLTSVGAESASSEPYTLVTTWPSLCSLIYNSCIHYVSNLCAIERGEGFLLVRGLRWHYPQQWSMVELTAVHSWGGDSGRLFTYISGDQEERPGFTSDGVRRGSLKDTAWMGCLSEGSCARRAQEGVCERSCAGLEAS